MARGLRAGDGGAHLMTFHPAGRGGLEGQLHLAGPAQPRFVLFQGHGLFLFVWPERNEVRKQTGLIIDFRQHQVRADLHHGGRL
jgi:hypothetical protein